VQEQDDHALTPVAPRKTRARSLIK
jgi:hypothetical protein